MNEIEATFSATSFSSFFGRYANIYDEYNELSSTLFCMAKSIWSVIMNQDSQPQRGAGIYAAYSYFDWKLKW